MRHEHQKALTPIECYKRGHWLPVGARPGDAGIYPVQAADGGFAGFRELVKIPASFAGRIWSEEVPRPDTEISFEDSATPEPDFRLGSKYSSEVAQIRSEFDQRITDWLDQNHNPKRLCIDAIQKTMPDISGQRIGHSLKRLGYHMESVRIWALA